MNRTDIIILCFILGVFLLYVFLCIKRKRRGRRETDWGRTNAVMTGRTNIILKPTQYTEYEIKYSVNGVMYQKWFDLYPGPDPGDIFGADTMVSIRYLLDNPAEFEVLEIMGDAADSFFDRYEI